MVAGSDGATGLWCGARSVPRQCPTPATAPPERAPLVATGVVAPHPGAACSRSFTPDAALHETLATAAGVTTTRCPLLPLAAAVCAAAGGHDAISSSRSTRSWGRWSTTTPRCPCRTRLCRSPLRVRVRERQARRRATLWPWAS